MFARLDYFAVGTGGRVGRWARRGLSGVWSEGWGAAFARACRADPPRKENRYPVPGIPPKGRSCTELRRLSGMQESK